MEIVLGIANDRRRPGAIRPLRKKERWQCALYAFSMALGVDPDEMIERVGHCGGQQLWNLEEPLCRRGFHPQELIHAFPEIGVFTPVERFPRLAPTSGAAVFNLPQCPFWDELILNARGVLECLTAGNSRHAVAFDRGEVFDPDSGSSTPYADIHVNPQLAWVLHVRHR